MVSNKVVVKITLDKEFWKKLVEMYPEIKEMPKATAIRYLLSKLLYF